MSYSEHRGEMPRDLRMLDRIVLELDAFEKIDFTQLTISQVEDLLWYSNFTADKHVSTKIREAVKQCLDLHSNRANRFSNRYLQFTP